MCTEYAGMSGKYDKRETTQSLDFISFDVYLQYHNMSQVLYNAQMSNTD